MSIENYGLNPDVIDSYRRTLYFNNDLLKKDFSLRYSFRQSEEVRKMRAGIGRARPASEEEIAKFEERQARLIEARRKRYFEKLDANVEPSVRRYAEGIKNLIGL